MTEAAARRLLLVTRNLPPLIGGMEKLNWHMADRLARVAQVRIVGPSGSKALAPPGIEVEEATLRPLSRFLVSSWLKAHRQSARWRPHVIMAGSGVTVPHAVLAARRCGARSVGYLHGLDVAVRNPIYRLLWLPAIRSLDRVVVNSRATCTLCLEAGVEAGRIHVVHPGVTLPASGAAPESAERFREMHGLGEGPILLSVGRMSERKGLRSFIRHALPAIAKELPEVRLLIIGDEPAEALHARPQTRAALLSEAQQRGVSHRLVFLGQVSDDTLRAAYYAADVHVFPVVDIPGDPEGFGMVAVEAAAHGLPTVAFASGGVVDAVSDGISGALVSGGDYAAFASAVVRVLRSGAELSVSSREFAGGFSWDRHGARLADAVFGAD